jgi:hypothetical protein
MQQKLSSDGLLEKNWEEEQKMSSDYSLIFPLAISVDFSESHVGTASFRGMLVHYFMERGNVDHYHQWLNKEGAHLFVNGFQTCAKINLPGGFAAFMDDMIKWSRENPSITLHF